MEGLGTWAWNVRGDGRGKCLGVGFESAWKVRGYVGVGSAWKVRGGVNKRKAG